MNADDKQSNVNPGPKRKISKATNLLAMIRAHRRVKAEMVELKNSEIDKKNSKFNP